MNTASNRVNLSRPLIYLAGAAFIFIFILGLGCGLAASGWWAGTPGSPTLIFVTAPPGPTPAALAGTPQPGSQAGSDLCPPPAGWAAYTIQPGDTLLGLANQFNTSPELIQQANCLAGSQLLAGHTLFLPPGATPTPCLPSSPVGWEPYQVQSGDTLYNLAVERGATVAALMQVNCLPSEAIAIGDTLYLPALPTPTPTLLPPPTPIPTPSPLPTPVPTPLPPTPFSVAAIPTPAPTVSIPTAATVSIPMSVSPAASTLFIPTAMPATPSPMPVSVATVAHSPFTLKEGIPAEIIDPSLPNAYEEFEYPHCNPDPSATPHPWLDAFDPWSNDPPYDVLTKVALGQRRYIFLCNFPDGPATAMVTRSDGITRSLKIWPSSVLPNLDLKMSDEARSFVEWVALPFHPTGTYTLTVTDNNSIPFPLDPSTFAVVPPDPSTAYILPVPPSGPPGTSFLIYYVNFELGQTLDFKLAFAGNSPIQRDPRAPYEVHPAGDWRVQITEPLLRINGKGWGQKILSSNSTNLEGTYVITSTHSEIHQKIWLQSNGYHEAPDD